MNEGVSLAAAFAGGVVSFLSPCVLPLVPAYLSHLVSGQPESGARKVLLFRALGFILGFSLAFIIFGASASILGKFLGANKSVLREVSGVAMIFFGLHMTGILRLEWLYREKRIAYTPKSGASWIASFFLGMVFAAGWTPCIGPVLASILVYAGSTETVNQGITLLAFYSLGLALPFFLSALAAQRLGRGLRGFNKYLPYISKAAGVLMIIFGYLVFNNKLQQLNSYFNFLQL